MSDQDWLTPAAAPGAYSHEYTTAGPSPRMPGHELRPLSLSEILDRTFAVYRSRFWLFCGIAAVAGAINLVAQILQLGVQHGARVSGSTGFYAATVITQILMVLVIYLAYGITQAATAYALTEVYLGRDTTIAESMKMTIGRWYAYLLIALWQYGSLLWVPLVAVLPGALFAFLFRTGAPILGATIMFCFLLAGFVLGVIRMMMNLLAVQASVDEHLTVRKAMRRSKHLSNGAKGRIFVVILIWGALLLVVGMIQAPLLYLIVLAVRKGGEAIGLQAVTMLVGFLGHALVTPVLLIGLSLIYFDQRVRKEAFDLELLIGTNPVVPMAPPIAPAPGWSPAETAPFTPTPEWSEPVAQQPMENTAAVEDNGARTPDEHSL